MSSDNVRVGVRVRPLNKRERSENAAAAAEAEARGREAPPAVAWNVDGEEGRVSSLDGGQNFAFDHVFEPTANNADVYGELAAPVVDAALAGFNAALFAYGQSGSGKTFSCSGTVEDPGITPLAVEKVMRSKAEAAGGRKYKVSVTYCEIYNEVIRDLLGEGGSGEVRIRENARGNTFIDGKRMVVETVEEALAVMEKGQALRSVGETGMNATSSRSHCIFTLMIESEGQAVGSEKTQRESFLHLVDLAGSERSKKTGARGATLREGNAINKSLLTLGKIINQLSAEGGPPKHLPYRDSKLTRVLRDALGGNSRTAVLCACTSSASQVEETLSTLKFAERAKNVTNDAKKNEVVDYKAKYREAMAELEVLRAGGGGVGASTGDGEVGGMDAVEMNVELLRLREELALFKERAESAELDTEHATGALRNKANEVRMLRAETARVITEMEDFSAREETLQQAIFQALNKIEDALESLAQSGKKGSRVLAAEEELQKVAMKLVMFVPEQEHEERVAEMEAKRKARELFLESIRTDRDTSDGCSSGVNSVDTIDYVHPSQALATGKIEPSVEKKGENSKLNGGDSHSDGSTAGDISFDSPVTSESAATKDDFREKENTPAVSDTPQTPKSSSKPSVTFRTGSPREEDGASKPVPVVQAGKAFHFNLSVPGGKKPATTGNGVSPILIQSFDASAVVKHLSDGDLSDDSTSKGSDGSGSSGATRSDTQKTQGQGYLSGSASFLVSAKKSGTGFFKKPLASMRSLGTFYGSATKSQASTNGGKKDDDSSESVSIPPTAPETAAKITASSGFVNSAAKAPTAPSASKPSARAATSTFPVAEEDIAPDSASDFDSLEEEGADSAAEGSADFAAEGSADIATKEPADVIAAEEPADFSAEEPVDIATEKPASTKAARKAAAKASAWIDLPAARPPRPPASVPPPSVPSA